MQNRTFHAFNFSTEGPTYSFLIISVLWIWIELQIESCYFTEKLIIDKKFFNNDVYGSPRYTSAICFTNSPVEVRFTPVIYRTTYL